MKEMACEFSQKICRYKKDLKKCNITKDYENAAQLVTFKNTHKFFNYKGLSLLKESA